GLGPEGEPGEYGGHGKHGEAGGGNVTVQPCLLRGGGPARFQPCGIFRVGDGSRYTPRLRSRKLHNLSSWLGASYCIVESLLWSAAIDRRFWAASESGDQSPHSKGRSRRGFRQASFVSNPTSRLHPLPFCSLCL